MSKTLVVYDAWMNVLDDKKNFSLPSDLIMQYKTIYGS